MKSLLLGAGAALLIAAPAAAHNHGQAGAKNAGCAVVSQTQVEQLFRDFDAAWATRNPDTVTNLFAPDAVLLATVSNTPRTDRAGIRDYFVTFLKNSPRGSIDTSTIRLGCNTATRVGTWTVNLTNPETNAQTTVRARFSFIYRYENGRWWIEHLHSSQMPEAASS